MAARSDLLRKLLPYSTALLVVALLYAAYTFYSRHADNASASAAIEQKRADDNKAVVERMGGENLKILNFSASPAVFGRGEKGVVCYAVNNAVAVKIDPFLEELKPSLTRCVDITPAKDTTYTLTATDAKGKQQTASLSVFVR
jgi:hypothetical protein